MEQSWADTNYQTDLLPSHLCVSPSMLGTLSLQPRSSREPTVQSWSKRGGTWAPAIFKSTWYYKVNLRTTGSTSHGAFRETWSPPGVRMQPPSRLTFPPFSLLFASSSTAPASIIPQKLPTSERSSCCHWARRGINDSSLGCCERRCVSCCGTIDFPSC